MDTPTSPPTIFKKKFLFTLEATFPEASFGPIDVKCRSRPRKEGKTDYLNAKTWIPGKESKDTITTVMDNRPGEMEPIFDVLRSCLDFSENNSQLKPDVTGTVSLKMHTGNGTLLETWILEDASPIDVQFEALDHSSTNTEDIEVTWRFKAVRYACPKSAALS